MPGPSSPLVTSRRNPLVQRFRLLARGEGAADELLLDGPHLLEEALDAGLPIDVAVFDGRRVARPELAGLAGRLGSDNVFLAAPDVLQAMSPVERAAGVVAIARRPSRSLESLFRGAPSPALVIVAAGVQDPGNVGALVRAAEAGGATGVVIAGPSADPWGWKALRGAMGSAFRLPVARLADLPHVIGAARAAGCRVVGTVASGGAAPDAVDLSGSTAMLLGGEGGGLDRGTLAECDALISIPMTAPVESLNVAVATALLVYEARRQRLTM